jgi:hypothetical protein
VLGGVDERGDGREGDADERGRESEELLAELPAERGADEDREDE